ncbi:MAG TPA: hypothetical protein VNQ77_16630 [Frankiaceae bacterium]|nr:hypothetical protein [Frankiaceae bacterium]
MRRATARPASVCALVLATSFAAPGSAAQPGPLDVGCGFTSVTDPRPESSYSGQLGYLHGGPVTQSGTLTCTIKVDVATHAAPYVHGTSASATGTGVTVLPPTVAAYVLPPLSSAYLCDEFTGTDGVTWYWNGDTSQWTTDANASCSLSVSASTPDPAFENPVSVVVDTLLDLVDLVDQAGAPVVCPVLASLAPGVPPAVDVRSDGDTYVAGARLLDCPPWEPANDLLDRERLRSLAAFARPPRTLGVIRISDDGGGPEWQVSGTLVSVDWQCGAVGSGVACDWHGYQVAPRCREAGAVAAVLSRDGRVRGRVSCVRGDVVEPATTEVASASRPVTYAERPTTPLPVTSLRCEADEGTGGPPVAPYVITCAYVF